MRAERTEGGRAMRAAGWLAPLAPGLLLLLAVAAASEAAPAGPVVTEVRVGSAEGRFTVEVLSSNLVKYALVEGPGEPFTLTFYLLDATFGFPSIAREVPDGPLRQVVATMIERDESRMARLDLVFTRQVQYRIAQDGGRLAIQTGEPGTAARVVLRGPIGPPPEPVPSPTARAGPGAVAPSPPAAAPPPAPIAVPPGAVAPAPPRGATVPSAPPSGPAPAAPATAAPAAPRTATAPSSPAPGAPPLAAPAAPRTSITPSGPAAPPPVTSPRPQTPGPALSARPAPVAPAPPAGPAGPPGAGTAAPRAERLSRILRLSRVRASPDTQIRIHADGPLTRYRAFTLASPSRVVIDFDGAAFGVSEATFAIGTPLVDRARLSRFRATPADVVRVVFDVKRPVPYWIEPVSDGVIVHIGALAPTR